MKLVVATPLYPPEAGGPATFAKTLEDELPGRGWSVETVRFADVRHLPKVFRHLAYARRVWQAARRSDAVLALDPVSTGAPALIAARLAQKRFYLRVAGDYAWEQGVQRWGVHDLLDTFAPSTRYPLAVRVLKSIESSVARAAERVIVPSRYLAEIVSFWGLQKEKMRIAYNAAPRPQAPEGNPLGKPFIVTIGRLVPWKGIAGVIGALEKMPEVMLVVVGDGPERERLEAAMRERHLSDRVTFTGNLSHEETLRYLAHADAFVLNTRYEGLSHLILEAFALGVPVATTLAGGNREIIRDQETGVVFSADDEAGIARAVEALRAPAFRERITDAARALAATFTTERMIDDVVSALTP